MGIKNVMMHERSVLDCINDGCMYYCSAIKGTMYAQNVCLCYFVSVPFE